MIALLVDGDPAGHMSDKAGIEFEYVACVFKIAEMDDLNLRKMGVATLSDPRTNRIAAGDAKILLGDRKFKLLDDILEGFGGAFLEQEGGELWLV